MKTKEELNKLKEEFKDLNEKLANLTDEKLNQVTGGHQPTCDSVCPYGVNEPTKENCYDTEPTCQYLNIENNRSYRTCTCMRCFEAGIYGVFVVLKPTTHDI